MDKYLKNKADNLIKSMYKTVKSLRKKNAIDDLFDSNRIAEVSPDEVPKGSTGGTLLKTDKKKKMEKCGDDPDCDCGAPVEKSENFVKNIMKNFETISIAYLAKKEFPCNENIQKIKKVKEKKD